MRAGALRDRITIRRRGPADDGYGNVVGAWVDLMTLWADVREAPGREVLGAGRIEAPRAATIRVRASSESRAIDVSDLVRARDRDWAIRSIAQVDAKGTMLEMLVETGVAL